MGLFDLFGPPSVKRMKSNKNIEGLIKALEYTGSQKKYYDAHQCHLETASALGDLGDIQAVPALIARFEDQDRMVRSYRKKATSSDFASERKRDDFVSEMKRYDREERLRAAWMLAKLKDKRAVAPLIKELRNRDSLLHDEIAIIRSLGIIGDSSAAYDLITVANDFLNNSAHYYSSKSEALIEALSSCDAANAKDTISKLKRDLEEGECLDILLKESNHRSSSMIAKIDNAVEKLSSNGGEKAKKSLLQAFSSKKIDTSVKREVAIILGRMGETKVETFLEDMIAHAEVSWDGPYVTPAYKKVIIAALQELRSKTLPPDQVIALRRQRIIKALSSHEVAPRKSACYESVAVGGPEIVAALIATLENFPQIQYNEAADVYQCSRKAAAYALGKIADSSSTEALIKALKQPEPNLPAGAPFAFGTNVLDGMREANTEFAKNILSAHT